MHHHMLNVNHEIEKHHGDGKLHSGWEFPVVEHPPSSFLNELSRAHRRRTKHQPRQNNVQPGDAEVNTQSTRLGVDQRMPPDKLLQRQHQNEDSQENSETNLIHVHRDILTQEADEGNLYGW